MRKAVLLVVGAAFLIGLGAFALSGPRSASAASKPHPLPTVPATTPVTAPPATTPVTAPPATTPATAPPRTAPPATSPPVTAHHKAKKTKTSTPVEAPPPTQFEPSFTPSPETFSGATTSSSSTSSTTSTTIAGIEGKVSNSPQTVPLATKASNGHVSGVFPILAYVGFGLAVLIVLIRLFVTRPGGQDRRPAA